MITETDLEQLNKVADEKGLKDEEIRPVYEKIVKISTSWSQKTDGVFANRKFACLLAAQLAVSPKKAIYFQLDTGNGTTNISLLLCAYLLAHTDHSPVFVTLNPILKRQTKLAAAQYGIEGLTVIEYSELE